MHDLIFVAAIIARMELTRDDLTHEILALFDAQNASHSAMPGMIRFHAVIDGTAPGQVYADQADRPTWAIVREAAYGTIFLGGALTSGVLSEHIALFKTLYPEVVLGLWPDDPFHAILPTPDYTGAAIDFDQRPPDHSLDALMTLPDGCTIRRADATPDLMLRSLEAEDRVRTYGSAEAAMQHEIGVYLMREDEILSEAFAGPPTRATREIGTITPEAHRRKGYSTIVCAHLVHLCESLGFDTYWNCAQQNIASAAIARKLGYRRERPYDVIAWIAPAP
jgi:RimJ/RimL family protein N-acetyltransferase